jgi:hypothetical protein
MLSKKIMLSDQYLLDVSILFAYSRPRMYTFILDSAISLVVFVVFRVWMFEH